MKRYSRKEAIYLAGDRADTLYRLQEGLVRIVELLPDGRTLTLRHILPGDFFGEEALEGKRHRYAAEAMTEAVVVGLDPKRMGHEELQLVARNLARQMRRVQAYEAHLQTGETSYRRVYLLDLKALEALAEGQLEAA
jgi:CRP-like cAMP-binding protein